MAKTEKRQSAFLLGTVHNAERGKRRRGRCRTRWRDAVERDGKRADVEQDLESVASHRSQWLAALLLS